MKSRSETSETRYRRYRIYLDKERDMDLIEKLDGMPKALRGNFIRTAMRLLMEEEARYVKIRKNDEENEKKKPFLDVFG